MVDVVVLALGEHTSCTCDDGGCGMRTPVLAVRDALRASGADVAVEVAHSDAEIDKALSGLLTARLIVASASDGQLRAVVRRLVRRYAPAPSKRPADLPVDRTVPDLPTIGLLPLGPDSTDLATRLGLPRDPAAIATAVLGGKTRNLDLLRTDSGSVTLDGALIGGVGPSGGAQAFQAIIEVDDAVLSHGTEPILAAVVANADRYATFDGLPLVINPDCADGVLNVAIAVPSARRTIGRAKVTLEVRRASGRAVAISPREEVPFLDDGVAGELSRKRSWWMERGAWSVYVP